MGLLPDQELASQSFKELCGSFQAALALGPCVLVIDGIDELGASVGLTPQQVGSFLIFFQSKNSFIICLNLKSLF